MQLYDGDKKMVEDGQAGIINRISALWNEGKIVAIKGIGGFLLTCDAANIKAVQELRKRKHRPTKPFALMFPDIQLLQNEVEIDQHEKEELQSAAAPIVLLQLKENVQTELALKDIAPKLNKIGVMRPYAPLFQLLLQQFSRPIVATSGNVSSASIVSDDEVALTELNSIADYILINNREIISPQDDSVISYSPNSQQRIVFRRARGFAPIYKNDIRKLSQWTILALGASLKSSFTLLHQQNIHISQYLGDTDNYNVQKKFETTLKHFLHLFNTQPKVILIDKHPGYFTSFLGRQLAKQWDAKLIELQHHEAHFASVLGEHNLLDESEPVLGVSWDGTGLGDDGQIWGGEFFIYHQHTFTRTNHFDYFDSFLGDKMAMEPRLSAFSLCNKIEEAESILKTKFTAPEWSNYQKLIAYNKLKTSSVGRMFDAVASLLGLIDKTSYEGEAAMLVEKMALQYFKNKLKIPPAWLENAQGENILSAQYLMKEIVTKIKEGKNKSELAAWFHVQLALSIKTIARQQQCNKICFSGGVFQNGLLVDLVNKLLSDKHELHFNKHLSPNDENISFGQIIWFNTSTNKPE
jgi:hydrogenase maturation protein HypF